MGKDILNLWLQLWVLGPAEEILTVMLTAGLSYLFLLLFVITDGVYKVNEWTVM
jgi:hypothetical protein